MSPATPTEMKIYPRKDKTLLGPGNFYFGDYGEIPISVSLTTKDHLIMVEPGEKHYIKKVLNMPFSVFTICTVKKKDDKVVVE